jgi:LysM repeat protein
LSDHLTTNNEPQQAHLGQAGDNARSAVTTPGGAAPPVTAIPPTQQVTPQQTVPTNQDLTPRQAPVEIVQIGGGGPVSTPAGSATPQAKAQQTPTPENNSQPPVAQASGPNPTQIGNTATPVARPADPNVPGSIAQVAREMGEELVNQDGQPVTEPTVVRPAPPPLAAAPAGSKQYKAEPGDSLSKMALKLMGSNTKANREAIIAANVSLQANPNMVIVGRAYIIPAAGAAPGAPATAIAQPAAPVNEPAPPVVAENRPAAQPEYFYTVKAGDSLTKICVEQLGTASALIAVKDLNKDVLKGGDTIRPNMKLRLPAKPLASAR